MKAIFLSDAHLRYPDDNNYKLLLDFLKRQKDLDALFLLGDIFEFWLGYNHVVFSAYVPLLEQLRQLRQNGTRLFFAEGNHDFNMGPYFTETLGCTVIREQKTMSWDGRRLLICHGDLLNPDPGYRRMRSFWRSLPVRFLARIVHPDLIRNFAFWLCDKSPKHDPEKYHRDPTPDLKAFIDTKSADEMEIIICGHYHHPVDSIYRDTRMIALGDWIEQFSYAEMVDGRITLKTLA